jgi:hypothetical protein
LTIDVWISHIGIDREAPEPGDPDPKTLPPRFGIKFNEHHAWKIMNALARTETANR